MDNAGVSRLVCRDCAFRHARSDTQPMPEDRAERAEPANRHAVPAVILAAALLVIFFWLSRHQLFFRDVEAHGRQGVALLICFIAVALSALVPPARSRNVLL